MLAELLIGRAQAELRPHLQALAGLEETLVGELDEARAAWPGVELDDALVVAYWGDRLDPSRGDKALSSMHTSDLFIACACCLGDETAIRSFEAKLFSQVRPVLVKFQRSGVNLDDVMQKLRARLLTAEPGELPKLADYSGRGSLKGWLRLAAGRLAIDKTRTQKKHSELADDFAAADQVAPDLAYLKEQYREPFKKAFEKALTELSPRERNFLRMTIIDGVTADKLGELHKVHRTTAGRWIAEARDKLAELTKKNLQATLNVQWSELDSIIHLVRSRIDVSVRRLLNEKK
jgi:RNA polymerase sigma-70 factor (ECF subfamily)